MELLRCRDLAVEMAAVGTATTVTMVVTVVVVVEEEAKMRLREEVPMVGEMGVKARIVVEKAPVVVVGVRVAPMGTVPMEDKARTEVVAEKEEEEAKMQLREVVPMVGGDWPRPWPISTTWMQRK